MLIKNIAAPPGFMTSEGAALELPDKGVTVLTGHNGAGKSRFIEAVAYVVWGKTLRGGAPWREGTPVETRVAMHNGQHVFERSAKAVLFDGEKGDRKSDTQAMINAVVPEFEFWRRTHVFSSTEAANFSGATDGERKRLLELLLGLSVFDEAKEALSAQLRAAAATHTTAVGLARAAAHVRDVAAGKYEALAAVTLPPFELGFPPEFVAAPDESLVAALQEREQVLAGQRQYRAPAPAVRVDMAPVQVRLAELYKAHELAKEGQCTRCGAEWDGDSPETYWAAAQIIEGNLAKLRQQDANAVKAFEKADAAEWERVRAVNGELNTLARELAKCSEQAAAHARSAKERSDFEAREAARLAAHRKRVAEHEQQVAAAQLELDEANELLEPLDVAAAERARDVAELEAANAVLGVKGLRGHVLGRALEGVETVANYWLGRVAPGVSLTLRADEKGHVGLDVRGYGDGEYASTSGGERRRIDACLLLALAEIAGAGQQRGTLFLDEVFDALDADGRELVAGALGELGERQPLVVITHSETLARSIPAVQRFEVKQGKLERLS